MKTKIILILSCLTAACLGLETFSIGQNCSTSEPFFFISTFYISPNPPAGCAVQYGTMLGTFNQDACPDEILISETYNQNMNYNQMNNSLSGCYNPGQNETFIFSVNPLHCNSGTYVIQVKLIQKYPSETLSCWQYQYNL